MLGGVTTVAKVAHVRLCHSRMFLSRAYPRETQGMVFDAHERAFRLFGGACRRGIYDNLSTAVDAVFLGKDRRFNRRFLQMCSHHLVEPVACTPAAGWEKGRVENQVGNLRGRLFTPRPRLASYAELNAWLADRCVAHARATAHAPGDDGPERLRGVRGRAAEPDRVSRAVRRLPRDRGRGLEEQPRAPRPQPLQRRRQGGAAAGAAARRRRPGVSSSGTTARSWASTRGASGAVRRCTTPGTISPCSRASPARSGTASPSATGPCRRA